MPGTEFPPPMARLDGSAARTPRRGDVVEGWYDEGDGLLGVIWWPRRAISNAVALASGLVRHLARVFENEATVGRDSGGDLRGEFWTSGVFVQPAEWPQWRAGRTGSGTARRPVWSGQATAMT